MGRCGLRNCPRAGSVFVGVCACFCNSCVLTVAICLNVLFNDWTTSFSTNRGHTATVQSTCLGVMLGGGLVAALLERKLGARGSAMLGSVLATAGLFAGGFAQSLAVVVVTVGALAGSGFSLLHLSILSTIVTRFSAHSGVISASIATVTGLLHLATPVLFRYLSDMYGWRGCLLVVAGLVSQTMVLGMLVTSPVFPSSQRPQRRGDRKAGCETAWPAVTAGTGPADDVARATATSRSQPQQHSTYPPTEDTDTLSHTSAACSHDERCLKSVSRGGATEGHIAAGEFPEVTCCNGQNEETDAKQDADAANFILVDVDPCSQSTSHQFRWSFLKSPLYLWLVATLVISMSTLISVVFLMLDLATSNGWSVQDGLFFNFCFMLSSLIGRTAVGLASLHRKSSSITLVVIGCSLGAVGIAPLGYVWSYKWMAGQLALMGASYGMLSGIYPSAVLQASGLQAYSLALGVTSTAEGVLDAGIGVLTGVLVDHLQSYKLPCLVYGVTSLIMGLVLVALWKFWKPSVSAHVSK